MANSEVEFTKIIHIWLCFVNRPAVARLALLCYTIFHMKLPKIAIFLVLMGLFFIISASSQAADDNEFNANYLISDEEMQDYQSMTRDDIQAFLEDYESTLADYKSTDVEDNVRLASDIIYRAAQTHKINPKYILVKLQKEQSLITDQTPSQKQLDGACGYGITDGCGWSCDTYLNNKGFGKQVDSAAGIIRWYYDHINIEPWIKRPNQTVIIDGQVVVPQNFATAFLYTYTPHVQGNKNFWILWNKWFGQVYPNGTLARGLNDPTVYLIQDGKKRPIKSMAVLISRFDPNNIIKIIDSELNNIATGTEISLPNYSILKQGGNYYLLDDDILRPFASYEVVKKLGYYPDEIISVQPEDLNGYKIGRPIQLDSANPAGRLVKLKENSKLYYLKDGFYYPIIDEKTAKINFPNLSIEKIPIAEMQSYTAGDILKFKDGTLMGIEGSNKIYVIEDGKKRHIASEEVFNAYGWDWKNIIWTDQFTGMSHPTGQPIYLPTRLATAAKMIDVKTEADKINTLDATDKIEENGKMYTVPEEKTIYVGTAFDTKVNTYLVADYETKEILAGKNIDVIRPAASFTKVLTAYRLMLEGLPFNKSTVYNLAEHKPVYADFRIAEGEKILNRNLMYSFLVSSLNTPSKMLVSNVEKNEDLFISRMNKQLRDWGMEKSKFVDTCGYDLGNLTTAREYLTIFTNAENNKEIHSILGMKKYEYDEIIDKDGKPHHFDYHSDELVNKTGLTFSIISSKTAYLNEAGAGLAMLITRPSDNRKFVIITMGNPDYTNRFDEPERLARWAIKNF